jgi:hypothetical protein
MSVRRRCVDLLQYFNPFAANLASPPPQDDALPAAKRPRLEASTSTSTAADAATGADTFFDADTYFYVPTIDAVTATTTAPDVTGTVCVAPTVTDAVTPAPASLPSAGTSRARQLPSEWSPEEDAKLTEAVTELGCKSWVRVAALVPRRTNKQCSQRWVESLDPDINRSKWSMEEDARLTDAVTELGGNDWVAIAALVPGRTTYQCRQRWGKTLDPAISTDKWTPEEDAKLTEVVTELGCKSWVLVAELVPRRTNTQCRLRWFNRSGPDMINRGKWSLEEDAKLTEAVKKHGVYNWYAVAARVPGRIHNQCRHRWVSYLGPTIEHTTGKWKPEEDAKLNDAVKEHGDNNSVTVAAMVPGRSNVQCRQRWAEALAPTIADTVVDAHTSETEPVTTACTASSDDTIAVAPTAAVTVPSTLPSAGSSRSRTPPHRWTPEEDATLTEAVAGFGKDWVRVAALVPRRTNKQCGQRWVESLDPEINRGKWSLEEDAKLAEAVKKHGVNDWAAVAALVPGRIQIRCRQRWGKTLVPDLNTGKWTLKEDAKLTEAVTDHGNNWVQVATMVPGRTNRQCRYRWAKCLDPTIE